MIVVPFIALCFSAPVAMILGLAWFASSGRYDGVPTSREMLVFAVATGLISLALALLARPRPRR